MAGEFDGMVEAPNPFAGMVEEEKDPFKGMKEQSVPSRMLDYGKMVVQGAKEDVGQRLQGVAEVFPPNEADATNQEMGRLMWQEGLSWNDAKAKAEEMRVAKQVVVPSATTTPVHQLGTWIKDVGKDSLQPYQEQGLPGDVATGAGSMASNILPALAGPVGRGIAYATLPFGGAGEAAERARKFSKEQSDKGLPGLPEEKVTEAARYGLIPGATDWIDLELGRALGFKPTKMLTKVVGRIFAGAGAEGLQEGVQELMQNAIAKHIYNPNQEYTENVLYNALVGALLGGAAKPALGALEDRAHNAAPAATGSLITQGLQIPIVGPVVQTPSVQPSPTTQALVNSLTPNGVVSPTPIPVPIPPQPTQQSTPVQPQPQAPSQDQTDPNAVPFTQITEPDDISQLRRLANFLNSSANAATRGGSITPAPTTPTPAPTTQATPEVDESISGIVPEPVQQTPSIENQNEFYSPLPITPQGVNDNPTLKRPLPEAANTNVSPAQIANEKFVSKMGFGGQTTGEPVNANSPSTSLPLPDRVSERTWRNNGQWMTPDDVLQSGAVWQGASEMAAEQNISEASAFAYLVNNMWDMQKANRHITEEQAARYIRVERAKGAGWSVTSNEHIENIEQSAARQPSTARAEGELVLQQWLDKNLAPGASSFRTNEWLTLPEGQIYIRLSKRPEISGMGRTIDVSSVNFDQQSTGAFSNYLTYLENVALRTESVNGIFVENVLNSRLAKFLERHGYKEVPGFPPSYVMSLQDLSKLRWGMSLGKDGKIERTTPTPFPNGATKESGFTPASTAGSIDVQKFTTPPPSAPSITEVASVSKMATKPTDGTIDTNPVIDRRFLEVNKAALYGDYAQLPSVVVKEATQNAFDAIKGAIEQGKIKEGRIDIALVPSENTIAILDNGMGMHPDVLGGPFLSPGGSRKQTSRPSGGFGFAKLPFLFESKRIFVETLHNGVLYTLDTSGANIESFLLEGNAVAKPKIQHRVPTSADLQTFPDGHGTKVVVILPKQITDHNTGKTTKIDIPARVTEYSYPSLQRSPLFDNITVDVTTVGRYAGRETQNTQTQLIGKNFPYKKFAALADYRFPWGTVRVYRTKEASRGLYNNAHVLSNGLWQFTVNIADETNTTLPHEFYLDVEPIAAPGSPDYPFAPNRQKWSDSSDVQTSIKAVTRHIATSYKYETYRQNVENYGDLYYYSTGPGGETIRSEKKPIVLKSAHVATPMGMITPSDISVAENGKIVNPSRPTPQLTPDQLKAAALPKLESLIMPQSEIDTERPLFIDNTVIETSPGITQSLSEMARTKFGYRFDQYMHQVGSMMLELRDATAEAMHKAVPDPKVFAGGRSGRTNLSYLAMKNDAVGIALDPAYRGVNIKIPFSAMMLNIAVPENMSMPGADEPVSTALALRGTMIHEFAHFQERSDKEGHSPFSTEMQRINYVLGASSVFNVFAFDQRLADIINDNWDIQLFLHGVIEGGSFNVSTRGSSFNDSAQSETVGNTAADMGAYGPPRGEGTDLYAILGDRAASASGELYDSERASAVEKYGTARTVGWEAADQQSADRRAIAADGDPDVSAAQRQPEITEVIDRLSNLYSKRPARRRRGATGGGSGLGTNLPIGVRNAAAHASRFTSFYKYMASLGQLITANPFFDPILRYGEGVRLQHNDESRIQDSAMRISKRWQRLGQQQGDAVTTVMDDLAHMNYRSPAEVAAGVERMPTPAEVTTLVQQHGLSQDGEIVVNAVRQMFSAFLNLIEGNAIHTAQRLISDPVVLATKIGQIQAQMANLRRKPYFPFMRFGRHFVVVKDAAGNTVHYETFERVGFRSAANLQKTALQRLRHQFPQYQVEPGYIPETATPYQGMPSALLDLIKTNLQLTPMQIAALEQMQLQQAPALAFKQRMFKSNQVPGYSRDFQRSFAKYFFHGARYYARTKHVPYLQQHIEAAKKIPDVTANRIAGFMQDHLQNSILDAKGDYGTLKGAAFLWALGFSPAAATMNMTQTPLVTYPFMAARFGGIGVGDARAIAAITKASATVKNFYRRGTYTAAITAGGASFDTRAMNYGIKTGRVSETMAAQLAAIAQGNNLIYGIAGNKAQRTAVWIAEKGASMFELAEQFNRRVAYMAALDLAMAHPTAQAVQEASSIYADELKELTNSFTPREAAAIITAVYVTDKTQFVYARYERARYSRSGMAGVVLIFKKYINDLLWLMGQNKSDVAPRMILMMMLMGGTAGLPFYDDIADIVKWLGHWLFGKHVDISKMTREFIEEMVDPEKVPPDLILHGASRYGWGLAPLVEAMGGGPTMPVLDRSRSVSSGKVLPISPGALFTPGHDVNQGIAEQTQRASGAIFSIGFNLTKALNSDREVTDFKRWESAMPKALSSLSHAWRYFDEGRERGKGGPDSAPTTVPFNVRDAREMMEVLAIAAGYQLHRVQSKQEMESIQAEISKYYTVTRQGLYHQYFEATYGKSTEEVDNVMKAVKDFNQGLPDWAAPMAITPNSLLASIKSQAMQKNATESGVPLKKSTIGISQHVQKLFPEVKEIDVRRTNQ